MLGRPGFSDPRCLLSSTLARALCDNAYSEASHRPNTFKEHSQFSSHLCIFLDLLFQCTEPKHSSKQQ